MTQPARSETRTPKLRAWVLGLAIAATLGVTANAANSPAPAKAAAKKTSYAALDKLPDWSGAWALDNESFAKERQATDSPDPNNPNVPKLKKKYWDYRMLNKVQNKGVDGKGATNNAALCIPDGMPGVMSTPQEHEYLFTPGRVTIIVGNGEIRRIYTDGRKLPDDPDPKFEGHSIGHWEGDTLVVETIGILPKAEIFVGLPQTDGTHVLEHIHKVNDKKLQIDTVVTNEQMFDEPFKYTRTYDHLDDITEALCTENNRDTNEHVDLTPPPL